MGEVNCVHFNGYRPCGLSAKCDSSCESRSLVQQRILLIHLGALGAVVRSTALLSLIHDQYPGAHLTWVTQKPADQLLRGHPLIQRVLTTEAQDLLKLSALEFDVALVVDKSLEAGGVLRTTRAKKVLGFVVDPRGVVVPATEAAEELWKIGLDDHLKFRVNQRSELDLIIQSLELKRNAQIEYSLPLSPIEMESVRHRKAIWSEQNRYRILGLNTGCSPGMPYKKLTVEAHRKLIQLLSDREDIQIVLLGGPEDDARNQEIARGLPVLQTPTRNGLRDGLISVATCDLIFTGDSLGMHMAIAQKIPVVAWFGPTCAHEIEFFNRGEAILSEASCGPCWKRSCQKSLMCYDQLDLRKVAATLDRRLRPCLSNQPTNLQNQDHQQTR